MELLKVMVFVSAFVHLTWGLSIEGKQNGTCIDWILMCVYYNHINMSELHMLELKLIIYSGLLYSHLYILSYCCAVAFFIEHSMQYKNAGKISVHNV